MADAIPIQSRAAAAPAKRGPTGRLLAFLFGFVFWLVLGLLGNILFEWVCMGFLWPDEGPRRSQAMLQEELGYLQNDFKESLLVERPAAFAAELVRLIHQRIYVRSGFEDWLNRTEQAALRPQDSLFGRQVRHLARGVREYGRAAMIATEVYAVRVAVLILAMPVFVLAGLVGLVDGLVQRDLRRFRAGREHGQVFHLAKRAIAPAITLPWILYLAWPTAVHPNVIILPFAVLFGAVLAVSTATFKKYL